MNFFHHFYTSFGFFGRLWERILESFEHRFSPEQMAAAVQCLFDTTLIVLVAVLIWWMLRRIVVGVETKLVRVRGEQHRRRFETVTSLLLSVLRYTVYVVTGFLVLGAWGYDVKTLVIPASIVAAAVGFGSQGLVQDFITGLSLLAEDQLAVGDFVEISGKAGVVEEIGLRVVKIRDSMGAVHVIFNRNISMVSNYSDGSIQAVVDVFIEKKEEVERAKHIVDQVGAEIVQEVPYFTETPRVYGQYSTAMGENFLRVEVRVMPQREAAINDLYVDRVKRTLAAEKITVPDGRVRVIMLNDRFKRLLVRKVVSSSSMPAANDVMEGSV